MDFTLKIYKRLLLSILNNGYVIQTFEDFIKNPQPKAVVLRHDSDIWTFADLNMALLESVLSVRATYYFRVPETFDIDIIKEIKSLNHEIGYHYEDLVRFKGNYEKAIENFKSNLSKIRQIYPVKTVARHGRPLSKIESLDMWKKYSLRDFGVIAEPYLDVNYSEVLYLTDNGSKWNADKDNIRDKVESGFSFNIKSTEDLIAHFNSKKLPDKIILNIHPARWTDNIMIWIYRFLLQKIKNVAKKWLNMLRNKI
jgi:hypothetical protein